MADLSLDAVIEQQKARRRTGQGKRMGGQGKPRSMVNQASWFEGERNDVDVRAKIIQNKRVGDVRNKIILNKRLRMRDARDRLAEIAKQGDAREKIIKLRKKTAGTHAAQVKTAAAVLAKLGQVKKDIRNENRLPNNKGNVRMQGSSLIRTVSGKDTNGKLVIVQGKKTFRNPSAGPRSQTMSKITDGNRYHPIPNNPNVVTIKNEKAGFNNRPQFQQQYGSYRERGMKVPLMKFPPNNPGYAHMGMPTIPPQNPLMSGMRSDNMSRARVPQPRGGGYGYSRSPEREQIRPTRLRITTVNNYREPSPVYEDDWSHQFPTRVPARMPVSRMPSNRPPILETPPRLPPAPVPARKRSMYDDSMMQPVSRPKKMASISSSLMARLDQQQPDQPRGVKVMVTNLHPCVNVEDVEELFGTIGPIMSARMMREGVAEAVFMNEEDALKSVDVFNKRQLDGQPMNVVVLSKRPPPLISNPPPPPPPRTFTRSILKSASGSSNDNVSLPVLRGVKKGNQIAPDIPTIHQALFNSQTQASTSQHVFLVKLPKQPKKKGNT